MTRHRRYRMRRKTRLRLRAPAVTLFLLACLLSLDGTGVLRTGLLCAILHESAHALVYRKLWHRWPDLAVLTVVGTGTLKGVGVGTIVAALTYGRTAGLIGNLIDKKFYFVSVLEK